MLLETEPSQAEPINEQCAYFMTKCGTCTAVQTIDGLQFSEKCFFMVSLYFLQLRSNDFYDRRETVCH